MSLRLDRRELLGLIGAAAAPAAVAKADQATGAFHHGVAAGDPLADRLIIWTRITTEAAALPLDWQIATDPAFTRIVRRGHVTAEATRDHTVKVDVDGLKPATEYHYRFLAGGQASPVGRARTLPAGATPEVTLAVVNCQLYSGGLFNAYDAVAREPKLDAIVHLGDYIYEYGAGPDDYGMTIGQKIGRIPEPPHELLTLADYRRRHAQYKTDPDLQAAHARAAFICVWDDHEAANDAWTGGAENHQPATEGDWVTRRTQAIRAYYEWMPIREPAAGETSLAIQRRFDFGDLASLHMVETRFASRSHQLSFADMEMTPAGAAAFDAKRRDPARQLLGPAQARWLADGLKASHAAGRPWQVLGNQVVMAEVFGPDVDPADPALVAMLASLPPYVRTTIQAAIATSKLGLPQNMDAWDGYPAERDRLYAAFQASGARPVVLSGDSHAFWGNELKAGDRVVAVELGVSSITSPSNGDAMPDFPLGPELAKKNDQVLFCDQRAKGYVLLTLRRDEAIADYRAVSTIVAKPYELATIKRYRIPADPAKGHLIEA